MIVNAIIAEYNPLHKGHEYLINMGKKITGADYTIVIMSGNYVQRGEPAIMDMSIRTEAALICGADLVIELPHYYSTASAEYFAKGAVALIEKLGVATHLVFGCEYNNTALLEDIAAFSIEYEKEIYEIMLTHMSKGASYPKAESQAICELMEINLTGENENRYPVLSQYSKEELSDILSSPNSTLGICYIKALMSMNSNIIPVAIERVKSPHDDYSLGALSSSAIRKELIENNFAPLKEQLSGDIYDLYADNIDISFPISIDDLSDILLYKLRSVIYGNGARVKSNGIIALCEYLDVSDTLAARIINNLGSFKSFSQFVALLKEKSVTYSHISRALLHIVLDIKKSNATKYIGNDYSLYARILGFRKESTDIMSEIKEHSSIPMISKLADAEDIIDDQLTLKLLSESVNASELYSYLLSSRFGCEFISEYSRSIVIL